MGTKRTKKTRTKQTKKTRTKKTKKTRTKKTRKYGGVFTDAEKQADAEKKADAVMEVFQSVLETSKHNFTLLNVITPDFLSTIMRPLLVKYILNHDSQNVGNTFGNITKLTNGSIPGMPHDAKNGPNPLLNNIPQWLATPAANVNDTSELAVDDTASGSAANVNSAADNAAGVNSAANVTPNPAVDNTASGSTPDAIAPPAAVVITDSTTP